MRVAVVGATGAVGSTVLGVMRERKFYADEVVPFASDRSAGRTIDCPVDCAPWSGECVASERWRVRPDRPPCLHWNERTA